jgi:hypothetical protein
MLFSFQWLPVIGISAIVKHLKKSYELSFECYYVIVFFVTNYHQFQ